MGEILALAASLEDLGHKTNNKTVSILSETLNEATRVIFKQQKIALARSTRTGQPRKPFLPRPVLGTSTGPTKRRRGTSSAICKIGAATRSKRNNDH